MLKDVLVYENNSAEMFSVLKAVDDTNWEDSIVKDGKEFFLFFLGTFPETEIEKAIAAYEERK